MNPSTPPGSLEAEIRRFDPTLPLERAWLPPSSWYTERAFHDLDRATVFRRHWLFAARAAQLRRPGDYVATVIAGEPVVVVRGHGGTLRAFVNVCRHHAAMVMVGEGNAGQLVCPYHGWTYALDGRLVRAPELGPVCDFDRDDTALSPLHVAQWMGFVFVALGETPPPPPDEAFAGLAARLDAMRTSALRFVRRVTWRVACNWKVYVDNYLDGGYHVATLHRDLAAQLDLASYRTEIFDAYSIQSGGGVGTDRADAAARGDADEAIVASEANAHADAPAGGDFASRIGERVLYAWIHPNFMINRYGPWMDTNVVLPVDEHTCDVVFDYYLDPGYRAGGDFVERSLAASDQVQREDIEICESVQRGLASSRYDRGRYSARREGAELHFHRLLAADYAAR